MKILQPIASTLLVGLFAAAGFTGCSTTDTNYSPRTAADSESSVERRAALGVRSERHLDVALLTARQVIGGRLEYSAEHFTIVACGPAVRRLADDDGIADRIEELPADRVDIKACGLTVERLRIDADDSENTHGADIVACPACLEIVRKEGSA